MTADESGDIWDRRRRNLRALIAYKGTKPSIISREAKLSVNTLSKFLTGETRSLRWESLERVCNALDIPNIYILDSKNPLSESRASLYQMIEKMSDDEAEKALQWLKDNISI